MRRSRRVLAVLGASICLSAAGAAFQAQVVPTDVQMPGTQPQEVPDLIPPNNCDNCHAGYDTSVEPAFLWRGSMMSHASRDPLFWATVGVAEQDFQGAGDLCLRCHVSDGWIAGRSTPTDGSAFTDADATGVSCHLCHLMTNPDDSDPVLDGVQIAPYIANDEGTPPEGYYGSGMFVLWPGNERLGPYSDATAAPHGTIQSSFHRSVDFCGTCHDVSNPVVGDLAHNNGSQTPLDPGTYSGVPGTPVDGKAAFNNFPFQYGIVERTYSEYKASLFPTTLVSAYTGLPAELQDGAIEAAYLAATAVRPDGFYADGTPRYFSCQTCHLPPVTGKGCKQQQAPVRPDLPWHDMTGGNYWMPEAMMYMDGQDTLPLGPDLTSTEVAALNAGKARALETLSRAASLSVQDNTLRVTNLTGHKLISGYPEGRRMWLNIKWMDGMGTVLREDGAYGAITVDIGGTPTMVETLLDLDDPHGRVYEAHYGMTQEWASQLLALGYPSSLALAYDRTTGAVTLTLGNLAAQAPGTDAQTFHFVLNNAVLSDNRIPPWGMSYNAARDRNTLPVPETQFGNPGPDGVYAHYDEVALDPPIGAATATIDLLYQPTSWEYIQFLYLANDGSAGTLLAPTGDDMLDGWLNTGMAAPEVIASTTWTAPFDDCNGNGIDDLEDIASGTSPDCNGNSVPDECDPDGDGNGIPDECDGGVGQPVCFGVGCPCGNDDPEAGCVNSTGSGAYLSGSGSASVSSDDLALTAIGCPPNNSGLFVLGTSIFPAPVSVGDGLGCTGGLYRYFPGVVGPSGTFVLTQPVAGAPAGFISPGDTRSFQAWTRDVLCGPPPSPCPSPCGQNNNLSNACTVVFAP